MLISDLIRPVLRAAPNIRGKGRAAAVLNRRLLERGIDPIVECQMARRHKLRLDLRVPTQMHAYYSGQYNDEMLSALLAYLRPGGGVLDVGANIGMISVPLALAARKSGGHLFAFEPVLSNVEWLTHNLGINDCLGCSTVFPFGLSDAPGNVEIVLADDFATGSTVGNAVIADRDFNPHFRRTVIRLDTLDRVWPEGSRLDVIKLDIEGHEHRFLAGAKRTIKTYQPALMIESNRIHYARQGLDFDTLIPQLLPSNYGPIAQTDADILFAPL